MVQVLSAGSSSAAATAPTLQYAPRAAPSGPLNTSPAKPNNISSALDGIAELQQVLPCLPVYSWLVCALSQSELSHAGGLFCGLGLQKRLSQGHVAHVLLPMC